MKLTDTINQIYQTTRRIVTLHYRGYGYRGCDCDCDNMIVTLHYLGYGYRGCDCDHMIVFDNITRLTLVSCNYVAETNRSTEGSLRKGWHNGCRHCSLCPAK